MPQSYFPRADAKGGWRTVTERKAMRRVCGMDALKLDQAWEFNQRCASHTGLVVVRKGWLVFEKYVGRASRTCNPDMASTGKAFTSIACGILLREFANRLPNGLSTKVFTKEFLPEAFPLDDPRKADITLGQLLCMTAGYHGEGSSPGFRGGQIVPLSPVPGQDIRNLDMSSIRTELWCKPGDGYSYSSPAPHIASIVLRRITGMDLKDYIQARLGTPQEWGEWDYCLRRGDYVQKVANGAGSIALHATDAVRFGYCLAQGGLWNGVRLVPADYIKMCHTPSPFNPHTPFSLQWEHNADGHIAGAPRDAFFKSGAGGFCLYVVPSLDIVVYRMGGSTGQYDPTFTNITQPQPDTSRDTWKPAPRSLFYDGGLYGEDGLRRVLEMVCAAVID